MSEQAVQLLVVADGKLKVTRDDARLLVVAGGVAGELEDLGAEVLHDRSEVYGGAAAHALPLLEAALAAGTPPPVVLTGDAEQQEAAGGGGERREGSGRGR